MTDTERVRMIIKNENITLDKFSEITGISRSTIGSMFNKGTKPSFDVLSKIAYAYPHYSMHWLLTGEGDMLVEEKKMEVVPVTDIKFMSVPLVPISAHAGYPSAYGDVEYVDTLPTFPVIVDREYKGKYRVFEVSGDSMDNGQREAICDKDKILGREVRRDLWRSKLHINDWFFVIVHREEGIIVKQITHHDVERGIITCHSLNPLFEDFEINLNDVAELYNVIKIVDRTARI